ncbi:hemolysin family protein [Actinorugispora endophytica]|uniref:CBS domain containing-hemolysin-like protein n=1 Tax=Actinorugispora endophytica TaxID=1605990 RepID=A0A4R6V0C8_9ACTN|nr:hemolysin family protein [Actinorugispora endophytica]TDQ52053.1 CBS domain containing-hemolysin-like protein [Actinorugispora endophytica]
MGVAFGLAVLLSLGASCFVSAEVALGRAARTGVAELVGGDRPGARRLGVIAADPARYLNMLLLLRVACEVLAALSLAVGFVDWLGLGWPAITLTAVVMILVSYVLIGVTPRILGRQFPAEVALVSANVIYPVTLVLGPLAQLLVFLGRAFTPRGKGDREGPFATEDELRHLVDLAERGHVIDPEEREMIHSVFRLDDTSVREVMVPHTDIVFLNADASAEDALSLALSSGFSRVPVVGENLDDIIGIVYLKDVVARLRDTWTGDGAGAEAGRTVRDIMREPNYVPDSKPVDELLREMQKQRIHLAVVIDEYGGTAGLVTIEDIVEEIVGEITDEYDDEVPPIEPLGDDRARVTARLPLGELAELFGVEIDAPDVETVGGLLAYTLGRVPVTGSEAEYAGLRLVAEDPSGRRNQTATVLVEKLPAPAESSGRAET